MKGKLTTSHAALHRMIGDAYVDFYDKIGDKLNYISKAWHQHLNTILQLEWEEEVSSIFRITNGKTITCIICWTKKPYT